MRLLASEMIDSIVQLLNFFIMRSIFRKNFSKEKQRTSASFDHRRITHGMVRINMADWMKFDLGFNTRDKHLPRRFISKEEEKKERIHSHLANKKGHEITNLSSNQSESFCLVVLCFLHRRKAEREKNMPEQPHGKENERKKKHQQSINSSYCT